MRNKQLEKPLEVAKNTLKPLYKKKSKTKLINTKNC